MSGIWLVKRLKLFILIRCFTWYFSCISYTSPGIWPRNSPNQQLFYQRTCQIFGLSNAFTRFLTLEIYLTFCLPLPPRLCTCWRDARMRTCFQCQGPRNGTRVRPRPAQCMWKVPKSLELLIKYCLIWQLIQKSLQSNSFTRDTCASEACLVYVKSPENA